MGVGQLTQSHFLPDGTEPLLEMTLGDLLRQVARETPDRILLVEGAADPAHRRRWTCQQLLDTAERLARALAARFAPGERVALLAPDTPEWLILQQASSLAGLVLVPVNPAYTARELDFVLRNSEAAGIVFAETSRGRNLRALVDEVAPALPHLRERLAMADLAALLASADPTRPLPRVSPGDTVQIQYTSGTTGFPKGAMLHHRGVINTARNVARRAGFAEGGVWLNAMPMFHIAGDIVSEIGCLAQRGTFVLMQGFDPGLMLELIEAERCTATLIVPTMILALLDHPERPTRDLSSLETILTGATNVPAALVERAQTTFGCQLIITFGLTESTGTLALTAPNDGIGDQTQSVGRPLPHIELKIVDPETHETLPLGQVGELWTRGYQVMTGYHGQPEVTARTVVDGWLRSGDLATMDARGYLKITGRLKDMIIRGGMNLYPKEIEDTLFDHPEVAQIAVVGLPDDKWGEVVAAVILPANPETPPPAEDLFRFARARLSPQKTPERWFFVESYPLTPSGKIQKNVLADWIGSGRIQAVDWSRPSLKD